MDAKEMGWEDLDWIDVVQDRDKWQAVVNKVMKLWVP
jgi:anaerobic selenocysteine-containing dehydrogenase